MSAAYSDLGFFQTSSQLKLPKTDNANSSTITVNGTLSVVDSARNEDNSLTGNGKIKAETGTAIKVGTQGTLTLGTNESESSGNEENVATDNPCIQGGNYGVIIEDDGENAGTFNFYDGQISGATKAINGEIAEINTPETYIVDIQVDENTGKEIATLNFAPKTPATPSRILINVILLPPELCFH